MSPSRVDLYGIIHKMLRVEIFDTATRIASANFADAAERAGVVSVFHNLAGFLDEHAEHEDTFVEPALRRADPVLADRVAAEHAQLDERFRAIADRVSGLETVGAEEAVGLGAHLHRDFSAFTGAYLTHMAIEEGEVNEVLWARYSDEELAGIRAELQASIPPERFAEWFARMVPAMNFQERAGVLTGIKQDAPPPVFEALSGVAREALGEAAWAEVEAALPS